MTFTLEEYTTAYRKAKVDLYYTSNPSLIEIAEFEKDLALNLQNLQIKVKGRGSKWIEDKNYLGGYTFSPKEISNYDDNSSQNRFTFIDPEKQWKNNQRATSINSENAPIAEFRIMSKCGMEFHVLSALWMIKVGSKFDQKLSGSAYGNRMRRKKNQDVNEFSLGTFEPYINPYRTWRDTGLNSMRDALNDKKEIVAITGDVKSFYHELDPSFMLNPHFMHDVLDISLTPEEERLHVIFIDSLIMWAKINGLEKGLPVGLPASAVVANMALIELDRLIEREIVPLYYGRYVDDIMLVMEDGMQFQSETEIWNWIMARCHKKLQWSSDDAENGNNDVKFSTRYLENSSICFSNDKNRIFMLSGTTGQALVDSIEKVVYSRSSEWRALPHLPSSSRDIAVKMVTAAQSDGEIADSLRKTSSLSMRRAEFALIIRDLEAFQRDLHPDSWTSSREVFFESFIDHVLVLPKIFDFVNYIPRVIKMAILTKEFVFLRKIIEKLNGIIVQVEKRCSIRVKSLQNETFSPIEVLRGWIKQMNSDICEIVYSSFPQNISQAERGLWESVEATLSHEIVHLPSDSITEILSMQCDLFCRDLAHLPYRFSKMPQELVPFECIPDKIDIGYFGPELKLDPRIVGGFLELQSLLKMNTDGIAIGFIFATRPFSIDELSLISMDPLSPVFQEKFGRIILALRGFVPEGEMPSLQNNQLNVPFDYRADDINVAVGSWKTEYSSWVASVVGTPEPDVTRYTRLTRLVNDVMSSSEKIDYLVMPELSIPIRWFLRIARKLRNRDINIISGVEYQSSGVNTVSNQVWAALRHDGLGFPSMIVYKQDKQLAAVHEELELKRIRNIRLDPEYPIDSPTVIVHGGFSFSMLVCSELTNIAHRAALRGKIDALFIPEWNQDISTFDSLVESASLDIHAFIIQCNDRTFGDSRIRAPFRETWKRDVVRFRGGRSDYFVTGVINVKSLRAFQTSYRSPEGPFKPVPDGFRIVDGRRKLPS